MDRRRRRRPGGRTGVPQSKSRVLIAAAVADGGLDRAKGHHFDGWERRARRILIDMIEEYARHTGHADLIREAIDGRVGEIPRHDDYTIKPLGPDTWDDFARLIERQGNGSMGRPSLVHQLPPARPR